MPKAKAAKLVEEESSGAKQKRLPEMEDAAIEEIEDAAETYAEWRDKRIGVQRKELDQKDVLLKVLKRHKRSSYRHGIFEVEILPEGERLKVRIKKEGEE